MKKLFLVIIPFIFVACGTFNPGTIDRRSAATSPESKIVDSVCVFIKQYEPSEAMLIFDADFRYYKFEPVYCSIFNKSSKKIIVNPDSIIAQENINEVIDRTTKNGFSYFLIWSSPWFVNLIVGWPFYYGVAWPIFGVIAGAQTSNTNSRIEEFYKSNRLKYTELMSGQEINGLLFIPKTKNEIIGINLIDENGSKIRFEFENKCKLFFK